nr:RHS repeat-associated core domain-containing protein [Halothiobacillus sp.]
DQVGSVVALVNNQGQVVGRLSYDSYGKVIQHQGTLPDYQYAGLYAHAESRLYLATYRAYGPATARWLSRDPIRESGGLNLYGYVSGNPIKLDDPRGLAAGDLKCQGFSGGCQNGGSFGSTGMYYIGGKLLCYSCAIKATGSTCLPAKEQLEIIGPFLQGGK